FFFFQAEDGIRDLIVTGVQTCALPISRRPAIARNIGCYGGDAQTGAHATGDCHARAFSRAAVRGQTAICGRADATVGMDRGFARSEERRVGKECRSRWGLEDEKEKEKG